MVTDSVVVMVTDPALLILIQEQQTITSPKVKRRETVNTR
jgi:hypothetical protein